MVCEKCGRRLDEGAEICPFCKQPIEIEEVTGEVITNRSTLSFLGILSIVSDALALVASVFLGPIGAAAGIVLASLGIFLSKIEHRKNINCGFKWLYGFFGGILAFIVALVALFIAMIIMTIASIFN